jgi:hypothetical protein
MKISLNKILLTVDFSDAEPVSGSAGRHGR